MLLISQKDELSIAHVKTERFNSSRLSNASGMAAGFESGFALGCDELDWLSVKVMISLNKFINLNIQGGIRNPPQNKCLLSYHHRILRLCSGETRPLLFLYTTVQKIMYPALTNIQKKRLIPIQNWKWR